MRLFSRLLVSGLALAFAMSLWVSPAQAASKKKKSYSSESSSSSKHVVKGMNFQGRSGFFYGDTSDVAGVGQAEGVINLNYQAGPSAAGQTQTGFGVTVTDTGFSTNYIGFPAGVHFGIGPDLELSIAEGGSFNMASAETIISNVGPTTQVFPGSSQAAFSGVVGMKYHIAAEGTRGLDFSAGGNVMTNISPSFGNVWYITPEGTVSYTLANSGMLLNGDLGLVIATQGPAFVKLDLGAAYPLDNKLSLIAELGANQAGYLGSMFAFGARTSLGEGLKGQAYLGAPFNGGGVLIGVGLIFGSI